MEVTGNWNNDFNANKATEELRQNCILTITFPDATDKIIADGLIAKAAECQNDIDKLKAELKQRFPDVYEQAFGNQSNN